MSEYDQAFPVPPLGETNTVVHEPVKTHDELKKEIADQQCSLEAARGKVTYWQQRFNRAQSDWAILSDRLNTEANDRDWCAEYDTIITELNETFTEFKLETRIKKYDVSVMMEATYYTTVTVEASSAEAAQEQVENMDTDDIDKNSSLDWERPDDVEFNVTDVEES